MPYLLAIGAGATSGALVHNVLFKHGEWHMHIPRLLASHIVGAITVLYVLNMVQETIHDAMSFMTVFGAAYLAALYTSMAVYRLWFHKTASFPGPKLAAVSKFWHIWHIKDSKNYLFMEKLYKKYGPFVRTGPNEISIFHPAGIQALDGWMNHNTKDIWYDVLQPRNSAIFTRDELDHKHRRKVWTQSLSQKSMDSLRPRLAKQTNDLCDCIDSYGGGRVDVGEVMSWFSFDAMGEVVFGEDFNLMRSRIWHPAILHRDRALAMLGPIADAIWIARIAFSFVPFYGRVRDWMQMVKFCEARMQARVERGEKNGSPDMAQWFINEYENLSGVMSLKARQNLLSGTAVSAVVAGSDTTRASLIAIWWYISKHPEHADKIRKEIASVDINDANALAVLPHLNGVISEVLRLVPPAMTGGGRITGPEGLWIDGTFIPAFTKVTAPKFVIMRMESAFEYPLEFIPERWYSRPELVKDKRAFGPFSFGNRQCVGKVLAYAELRLVTAALLDKYDVSYAPGYEPETMWRYMKDQVTAQPGDVFCVFTPRKQGSKREES